MEVEHVELGARRRVADRDAGHEPVALRLRQRVGALHLDGVLGRHDDERLGERVGRPVDGDLGLLHRLQERALRLGRGPVDLVADDDVGEDRPRAELEVAHVLVEDRDAGDVARQQVRGELHPADPAVDGAGEGLGQQRLADPGNVLHEEVPLGEEDGDRRPDDGLLALDDRVHGGGEGCRDLQHLVQRRAAAGGTEFGGRRAPALALQLAHGDPSVVGTGPTTRRAVGCPRSCLMRSGFREDLYAPPCSTPVGFPLQARGRLAAAPMDPCRRAVLPPLHSTAVTCAVQSKVPENCACDAVLMEAVE